MFRILQLFLRIQHLNNIWISVVLGYFDICRSNHPRSHIKPSWNPWPPKCLTTYFYSNQAVTHFGYFCSKVTTANKVNHLFCIQRLIVVSSSFLVTSKHKIQYSLIPWPKENSISKTDYPNPIKCVRWSS